MIGMPANPNVAREITRGSVVAVHTVHHPAGRHVDPLEEWFGRPTVIFTSAGRWRFATSRGRADAGPAVVVLGNQGDSYRVSHEDGAADDRSVSLTYTGTEGPTFRAPAVARTPALERLRLAVFGLAVAPPDAGRSLDLDAAALAIVAEASGDRAEPTPRTGRDGVQAALDFLGEHALDDEIDLARLAEAAALSPFHLHRLFRAELGLTPGRYLARVRLEHAAGLLLDSDRPVTRIAFDAGFGSLGHFHALFRRAYRRTPGEYRRLGPLA